MLSSHSAKRMPPPLPPSCRSGDRLLSLRFPPAPSGGTCGGFLCDEMGLGKTLQSLMLVVAHPPPPGWAVAAADAEEHHAGQVEAMEATQQQEAEAKAEAEEARRKLAVAAAQLLHAGAGDGGGGGRGRKGKMNAAAATAAAVRQAMKPPAAHKKKRISPGRVEEEVGVSEPCPVPVRTSLVVMPSNLISQVWRVDPESVGYPPHGVDSVPDCLLAVARHCKPTPPFLPPYTPSPPPPPPPSPPSVAG